MAEEEKAKSGSTSSSVRTISFGSRPLDLDTWSSSADLMEKPVPILMGLLPISDLFRTEWLTKSSVFGISSDFNGTAMKALFDRKLKEDYCPLTLEHMLASTASDCKDLNKPKEELFKGKRSQQQIYILKY